MKKCCEKWKNIDNHDFTITFPEYWETTKKIEPTLFDKRCVRYCPECSSSLEHTKQSDKVDLSKTYWGDYVLVKVKFKGSELKDGKWWHKSIWSEDDVVKTFAPTTFIQTSPKKRVEKMNICKGYIADISARQKINEIISIINKEVK